MIASFHQYLNQNDLNKKFTYCHHRTTITFFDVSLERDITRGVTVSPFRKETATNSVLLASSCHSSHVVKNLPVGELVRVKRNSSTIDIYNKVKQETCQRLVHRGYPEWSLKRACNIVDKIDCEKLLKNNKQKAKN